MMDAQGTGTDAGALSVTDRSELAQANARFAVGIGLVVYFLLSKPVAPHLADPGIGIALGYSAVALLYRLWIRYSARHIPWRINLAILLDHAMLGLYVYTTGVGGTLVYPIFLWVVIANGYVFGRRYLYLALATGLTIQAGLVLLSRHWTGFEPVALGQLLGLAAVALFVGTLLERLEMARLKLQNRVAVAEHRATHDQLTGVANRVLLDAFLGNQLARMQRYPSEHMLGLLYVDLDRFKAVNDAHGHDAGDHLLNQTAQRLRDCVRESDLVARLGGDEFVLVAPEVEDRFALAQLARRVLVHLAKDFHLSNATQPVRISASIGIAIAPEHSRDQERLLQLADAAMYRAKQQGRNRFAWALPDQPPRSHADLALLGGE